VAEEFGEKTYAIRFTPLARVIRWHFLGRLTFKIIVISNTPILINPSTQGKMSEHLRIES
jgi:hypothetical protein